jgi:UV DNA damage endonuclease
VALTRHGLRFGLCCQFLDRPIQFRTATHRYAASLSRRQRREYLGAIARANAEALAAAAAACDDLGIGAFRINSQFLPLATHPLTGYRLEEVDPTGATRTLLQSARDAARRLDIRLSFHPDQFVVLNSEREEVVAISVKEVDLQGELSELVGADTIVLHAGSLSGGPVAALDRLQRGIDRLGSAARTRLALENDDRLFGPAELLPICERLDIPLVYDVHHHRCRPDQLTISEATDRAAATWGEREPWMHISSPREGWKSPNPRPHAELIAPRDFPREWIGRTMTIDVEAKAKERAVLGLQAAVRRMERTKAKRRAERMARR